MRLVMFGTPAFAVPTLSALLDSRHEVVAVITPPDQPQGRSKRLVPCPVKETALKTGCNQIFCPESLDRRECEPVFLKTRAHAGVVVAYGRIFRPWALGLFPYGLLNIHPSLLPRHRGPSPVNGAILAGDRSTGITIMQLDQGMDTGDILLQEEVAIDPDETAGELEERLSHDAVDLLLRTLDQIEEGTAAPVPQDHARATLTGMLQKEDGRIDWTASAWEVHCRVRGTNPWPGARTLLGGRDLLLWRTAMAPDRSGPPGRLLIDGHRLFACAQTGSVELLTLQWPGKKPMDARSFLNGAHLSGKETLS